MNKVEFMPNRQISYHHELRPAFVAFLIDEKDIDKMKHYGEVKYNPAEKATVQLTSKQPAVEKSAPAKRPGRPRKAKPKEG